MAKNRFLPVNSVGRNRHQGGGEDKVVTESCDEVVVKRKGVAEAISTLESGKFCGMDGITAEHLKLCSVIVVELMSVGFTAMSGADLGIL